MEIFELSFFEFQTLTYLKVLSINFAGFSTKSSQFEYQTPIIFWKSWVGKFFFIYIHANNTLPLEMDT